MGLPGDLTSSPWKIIGNLLLIFALLSGGILGLGYWYYERQKAHFHRETEAQLTAIANLKVNQIVAWRQERMHDAMLVSDDPIFAYEVQEWFDGIAPSGRKEKILQRMQGLRQNMYEGIRLVDAQGTVRLAVPGASHAMTSLIKDVVFDALASGKVFFIDLHRSPNNEIRFDLVVPMQFSQNGQEKRVGIIIYQVNPQLFLDPLLQSWPVPSETAEINLVRREGNEVVFLNELRFRQDPSLTLRLSLSRSKDPAVKAALGYEGIVWGVDYRDIPVVAVTRVIPRSPWFLTAKMDVSEVDAPIRERFQLVAFLLIALIAASGSGLAYFWRNRDAYFYRQQFETQQEKEKALKESEAQLRFLSSQLMIVQEQERRRISKELHDELGQALMFLKFQLDRLSKEKRKTRAEFHSLLRYLDGMIENVRRLSWDLSPACLEQFGLATAVKNLLEEFGEHFEIRWTPDEIKGIDQLFSPLAQVNIYRIFQECLTNIGRHAQASQISVNLQQQEGQVIFSVADNGKGFDLAEVWERAGRQRGIGLAAMQERARLTGGFLEIWSQPGAGTKISFTIPVEHIGVSNGTLSNLAG